MQINIFLDDRERRLRKERRELYGTRAAALMLMAGRTGENDAEEFLKYQTKFFEIENRLHRIESDLLRIQGHYLGIEYPTKEEKPDWWVAGNDDPLLSEKGLIHLNKLVKDEKRKNTEWWVTIAASRI